MVQCRLDALLIWHMPHFSEFSIITEKRILWKKFLILHSFWVSPHTEDANIRCKSDFFPTKTRVKILSNQNQNKILWFSYLQGPRPWCPGTLWVHYTPGASAQWTQAWCLKQDKGWIRDTEWNNDKEVIWG